MTSIFRSLSLYATVFIVSSRPSVPERFSTNRPSLYRTKKEDFPTWVSPRSITLYNAFWSILKIFHSKMFHRSLVIGLIYGLRLQSSVLAIVVRQTFSSILHAVYHVIDSSPWSHIFFMGAFIAIINSSSYNLVFQLSHRQPPI